ncbi:MAG: ABC transporter permease [Planctomycetes bacterium]|nr:ABC transporter permease [Planctomycetota bacterium]
MNVRRAVNPVWLRRLVLGFATLLGVLLLCFLLLDCATDERALLDTSSEERATSAMSSANAVADAYVARRFRWRRHLPALWNDDVLDRRRFANAQIDRLEQVLGRSDAAALEAKALARASLLLQGWSAVDVIAERLRRESTPKELTDELLRALVDVGALERPALDAFRVREPRWEARGSRDALAHTVEQCARGDEDASTAEQEQRLLPYLWRAMEARSHGVEHDRLARVFTALRSRGPSLHGVPASGSATVPELRSWWRTYHLLHEDLAPDDRARAAFLETRFALWLRGVLAFDFGVDARGLPIGPELWRRLRTTLPLMALAMLMSFALAIPLGVLSVRAVPVFVRRAVAGIATVLYCTPRYVLATVLLMLFAVPGPLGVFPPTWSGSDDSWIQRAALPLAVLTLPGLVVVARYVRTSVLEALERDHVRTARAKGLAETRVLFLHAFRTAWSPVLTLLGEMIPALVGGSVLVELVFDVPGTGRYVLDALARRDAQVLMAVTLLSAVVTLIGLWCVEFLQWWTDPRRRHVA